jgi:hypothetical protein
VHCSYYRLDLRTKSSNLPDSGHVHYKQAAYMRLLKALRREMTLDALIHFHGKRLSIVIANPLISAASYHLDGRDRIENLSNAAPGLQDALDLAKHESAGVGRARTSIRTRDPRATGTRATSVCESKRAPVESETHDDLRGINTDTPEELERLVNFGY